MSNNIKKLHELISNLLNAGFTKEFLQKSWLPLVPPVLKECGETLRQKGLGNLVPQNPKNLPVKSKVDILNAVALLFIDLDAYCCFRENLPEDARKLWDAVVFNDYIGFGQAKEEYGLVIQIPGTKAHQHYYYYNRDPQVKDTLKMIPFKNPSWGYGYRQDNYFYLPAALRKILIKYYEVPAWAELSPIDNVPEGATVWAGSEEVFISEFYRLQVYHKQGRINYTAKWRPALSGLSKVQKTIKIVEFFPDTDVKRHKLLRTNMLATLIHYLAINEKKDIEPKDVLRDFFQNTYTTYFPASPMLLPDIKGFGYIENSDLEPFGKEMLALLKALPADSYVPIKNILGYCTFNLIEIEAVHRYDARNKLSLDWGAGTPTETSINYDNYNKALRLPLIRGSFFFFAALGLCELAYVQLNENDFGRLIFSAWDGLIAVKRTPLGDYVCGLTATHEVSVSKAGGFTLSDDALIIKLDSPDSPYASTLDVFAEQTGPITFRTDPHFFLKNVQRKEDLNTKIELFRQMVPGTIPKNWEDFFNTLRKKIDPLKLHGNCIVFNVDKENQELVRLLAQDPVLKPLISKAEGYLIIVPKKNYAALRGRLAEFGYLQT